MSDVNVSENTIKTNENLTRKQKFKRFMGKTLKFIDSNFEALFLIVFYIFFIIALFSIVKYGFFNVAIWERLLIGGIVLWLILGWLKKALKSPYVWAALCISRMK